MPFMFRIVCKITSLGRTFQLRNPKTSIRTFHKRAQTFRLARLWDQSQSRGLHHVQVEPQNEPSHRIENPPNNIRESISINQPSEISFRIPTVPQLCPGCGALSQATNADDAGYYSRTRKAVKSYLQFQTDAVPDLASATNSVQGVEELSEVQPNGGNYERTDTGLTTTPVEVPICDRCHNLLYNNQGKSIAHPTIEDLADSIAESPFRRNHVYHVVDAADFPLSLIPKIFTTLDLAKLRGQNRRARTKFTTKPSISFIITRSDLLGPSKEMVDRMMPYFQNVLRSALGRQARNTRLGNVRLVSAKRGWWTKELKDEIWERGGASWMVGKVNVGKSNLFPVLFPKGSGERAPVYSDLQDQNRDSSGEDQQAIQRDTYLREDSMLPPAQPEVNFPAMPLVSHLPGTTASPIRLSFGQHKGELIDLPGLDRGTLEQHVLPDHKLDLVMQHRPNVQQHIIKPGQSLLLGGGLIRITPQLDPNDPSMTMLAYPFVPIDAHVTATDKAVAIQQQQRDSGVKSILADGDGAFIKSGGTYALTTDVTKTRAGPLLRAGVPLTKIPFRVFSSDILIAGVGWVELVCQVQKSKAADRAISLDARSVNFARPTEEIHSVQGLPTQDHQPVESSIDFKPFYQQIADSPSSETPTTTEDSPGVPKVEIFSPNGKFIGQRKPLGAWLLWDEARIQRRGTKSTARPRKSMKGSKRRAKMER